MANFTGEIKRDLLKAMPPTDSCKCAMLCAAFNTSGDYLDRRPPEIRFTIENEEIASYLLELVNQVLGVQMTATAMRDPMKGRNKITCSYRGTQASAMREAMRAYNTGEDEAISYMCGAFLCSGSCTLPREGKKTGYHLEIVFDRSEDAEKFLYYLDSVQIIGNMIERGEKFVVYLKSRETISDFLSVIGAGGALKTLERVSASREESNKENRVSNCIAGNADRTAIASAMQTVAIERFKQEGILPTLPEPLRTIAEARLAYPTYSLTELAGKMGISKSCINHRMRKLMQLYEETYERNKK